MNQEESSVLLAPPIALMALSGLHKLLCWQIGGYNASNVKDRDSSANFVFRRKEVATMGCPEEGGSGKSDEP